MKPGITRHSYRSIFILLLAGLLFSGCAMIRQKVNLPEASLRVSGSIWDIYPHLKGEEFSEEIKRVDTLIKKTKDSALIADGHLRIAMLSMDHRSPAPNYMRALKELELYARLDDKGSKRGEIQNLISVLRRLNKISLEKKGADSRIEKLKSEKRELEKTVEQLKRLDLLIEEKRRNIR